MDTTGERLHHLGELCRLIRRHILVATSEAGSGHPTSGLSAVELCTGLFFGGTFRYDPERPDHPGNDRVVFSKGHATPLLYALWAAAGRVARSELRGYREFDSTLEGHPTPRFPYVDVATGSLGQGLSAGLGMALAAREIDDLPYRTYVLLGDSEMTEGSQWEAIQLAAHHGLDNLVGVLDVNRLGQRGETMYGHDVDAYARRVGAFGWRTLTLEDGHDLAAVVDAYEQVARGDGRPAMIVARTIKGKGVSFLEDREGWHGAAPDGDELQRALAEIGEVDPSLRGEISPPDAAAPRPRPPAEIAAPGWVRGQQVATRDAYGKALHRIFPAFPALVALDGEVSDSTRARHFAAGHADRFFEMYVAEQNMVGAALGLSRRGKLPFVSTFAAFLTRAHDQIRMCQYSDATIEFVGSHAGVSIGQDGPSQMGLEDLALFRSLLRSTVLYPCDAVSADRMVELLAREPGIGYLRLSRNATPVIYDRDDEFAVGGSRVLHGGPDDRATIVAAGVTLHEALAAHEELDRDGISARVVDLYSVRPVDRETLRRAADETGRIVTVEDHAAAGGIADAVREALSEAPVPLRSLAVRRIPRSGQPAELLAYAGIDRGAIAAAVRELIAGR